MKKKEQKASPITPASGNTELVEYNALSKDIEILPQSFEGSEILMGCVDGRVIIPVRTLSEMFDINYSKAMEKITSKSELFDGEVISLEKAEYLRLYPVTGSSDDIRSFDCFTIAGALQWITILSYGRYDLERKEYIVRVRRWLAKTGESVILGSPGIGSNNSPVMLADSLKEEMKRADAMTIIGVDISRAASACLAKLEDQFGESLDYLRALVSRQSDEDIPVLTATEIGKELGLSAQSVNNILEKLGYQKHDYRIKKTGAKQKVWNLTQSGKVYGEIILERHGGADVQYILWRREIIEVVRRAVFLDEEQSTLEEEA